METPPEQKFYLVVRVYRERKRVLFMSDNVDVARDRFKQYAEKLRDGSLYLWACRLEDRLQEISGGYNRTRW